MHIQVGGGLDSDLADAFALRNPRVALQFESYGNENWLVEDADGRRYVLRQQTLNADPRRIAFHCALQRHLNETGTPTPAIVAPVSGGDFIIDGDGKAWLLFEFIDGPSYDFSSRDQARAAGRCLAGLHAGAAALAAEAPGPEYKLPLRDCWINASRDLQELPRLLGIEMTDPDLEYLGRMWERVIDEWPVERYDTLPNGWLHGDYHGRNLVFDGDKIVAVFDFDDVDAGPYLIDVAFGTFKFGRESRASLRMRPPFMRAFLEGYESVRVLSDAERAALPVFFVMGHPPSPHRYAYWIRRGDAVLQRFRNEMTEIRARNDELKRIGDAGWPGPT